MATPERKDWTLFRKADESDLESEETIKWMKQYVGDVLEYDGRRMIMVWPGNVTTAEMRSKSKMCKPEHLSILISHGEADKRKSAYNAYQEAVRKAIADRSLVREETQERVKADLEAMMPYIYAFIGEEQDSKGKPKLHKVNLQRNTSAYEVLDPEMNEELKERLATCLDENIVPPLVTIDYREHSFSKEAVAKNNFFPTLKVPAACLRWWLQMQRKMLAAKMQKEAEASEDGAKEAPAKAKEPEKEKSREVEKLPSSKQLKTPDPPPFGKVKPLDRFLALEVGFVRLAEQGPVLSLGRCHLPVWSL